MPIPDLHTKNLWQMEALRMEFFLAVQYTILKPIMYSFGTKADPGFYAYSQPVSDAILNPAVACYYFRRTRCYVYLIPGYRASLHRCQRHVTGVFVAGLTAWNSLPDSLRDPALSSGSFRQPLKNEFFDCYSGHLAQ